ncbi:hypothetical protein EBU71_20230, partial [bacterium]|nr:hypothetical protein [Candidatus Elulimicrobium humile]
FNDGTDLFNVTDSLQWANNYDYRTQLPMMCWYKNDSIKYSNNRMGALYNWYVTNSKFNNNRNVCPVGWRVPSDIDWEKLAQNLGGESIAGAKLTSSLISDWFVISSYPSLNSLASIIS